MRDLRNEMYSVKDETSDNTIIHTKSGDKLKIEELEERVKQLERDVAILKSRHTTLR